MTSYDVIGMQINLFPALMASYDAHGEGFPILFKFRPFMQIPEKSNSRKRRFLVGISKSFYETLEGNAIAEEIRRQ